MRGIEVYRDPYCILSLLLQANHLAMQMKARLVRAAEVFQDEANLVAFTRHEIRVEEDAAGRNVADEGNVLIGRGFQGYPCGKPHEYARSIALLRVFYHDRGRGLLAAYPRS